MSRRTVRVVSGALALVVAGFLVLATGFEAVEPGESLLVRRLGKVVDRPMGAGLHWVIPLGIDRVDRVRIDEVRRLSIGFAGVPGPSTSPGSGEFLSGDLNLVKAEAVVQYRAADPAAFAMLGDRVEPLILGFGEAALSRALAHRAIDDALRADRLAIAAEVAEHLAEDCERFGLGLSILGVNLTEVRPPEEVRPDFAAAQSARSEAETRIRASEGHANRVQSSTASEVEAILDRSKAAADRSMILARARADRFRALAAEVNRSRELTIRRLYLDTLRDQLPAAGRMIVLSPDEALDLSILGSDQGPKDPERP